MGHKWWHPDFLDDENEKEEKPEKSFRDEPDYGSAAENVEVGAIASGPLYEEDEDEEEYSSNDVVSYSQDEDEEEYSSEDVDDDTLDDEEYSSDDEISNPYNDGLINTAKEAIKKGNARQLLQPLMILMADHPNYKLAVKGSQTVLTFGGTVIELPSKMMGAAENFLIDKIKNTIKGVAKNLDEDTLKLLLKYKEQILKGGKLFKNAKKLKSVLAFIAKASAAVTNPAIMKLWLTKQVSKVGGKAFKYTAKHLPKIAQIGGKSLVPLLGAGWLAYDVYKKTGSIWKALGAGLSGVALDIVTTIITGGSFGAATIPAILLDIAGTIAIEDVATKGDPVATYKALMEDYNANPEEYERYFKELLGLDKSVPKITEDRALMSAIKDLQRRLSILGPRDPGREPLEKQLKELLQKANPEGIGKVEGEEDVHDNEEYDDNDSITNSLSGMDQFKFGADENIITVGDEGGTTGEVDEPTGKELIDSFAKGETADVEDKEQAYSILDHWFRTNPEKGAEHLLLKGDNILLGFDERKIRIPVYVYKENLKDMASTVGGYLRNIDLDKLAPNERRYATRLLHYVNQAGGDTLMKDHTARMLFKIINEPSNDVHKVLNKIVEKDKFISHELLKKLNKTALSKSKRFAVRTALKTTMKTILPVFGAAFGAYHIYNHPKGGLLKSIGGGASLVASDVLQTTLVALGATAPEGIILGVVLDALIIDSFTDQNFGKNMEDLPDIVADMVENPKIYIDMIKDAVSVGEQPNEINIRKIKQTYGRMPKDELRVLYKQMDERLNASGDKAERARIQQVRDTIGNLINEPERKARAARTQNKIDESRKLRETKDGTDSRKTAISDYKLGQGG